MTTLVPEIPDEVLDWTACVNEDKLLMCYKKVFFNDFVILFLLYYTTTFLCSTLTKIHFMSACDIDFAIFFKHNFIFFRMSKMFSTFTI